MTLRLTSGKILLLSEGDICPECGLPPMLLAVLRLAAYLPAWHQVISALNATFTDGGEDKPLLWAAMVHYVSRLLAAVVEQYNDEKGIAASLCTPMRFFCSRSSDKDPEIWDAAGAVLMRACVAAGLETVNADDVQSVLVLSLQTQILLASHGRLLWARRALQTVLQKSKRACYRRAL